MPDFLSVKFSLNDQRYNGPETDEQAVIYAEIDDEYDIDTLKMQAMALIGKLDSELARIEISESKEFGWKRELSNSEVEKRILEFMSLYPNWECQYDLNGDVIFSENQCSHIDIEGSRCRRYGKIYREISLSDEYKAKVAVHLCGEHYSEFRDVDSTRTI